MDLAHEGWRNFLLDRRMGELWRRGFRGFFLDTLASYMAATTTAAERDRQTSALASLVREMHARYPGVRLIFNRGFEVLPLVGSLAHGLVAESLFEGWDPTAESYRAVEPAAREWLLQKLTEARDQHGLSVTVLDYVAPTEHDKARQTARRIHQLGFTPWVSTPALDRLGHGLIEIVPRRVLALYDSSVETLDSASGHRWASTILEYEGYAVDFLAISDALPADALQGRYAGVLVWLSQKTELRLDRYLGWLKRQFDDGIPVAVMGTPGFVPDDEFLDRLGLKRVKSRLQKPLRIVHSDGVIGFEIEPRVRSRGLMAIRSRSGKNQVHLRIEDAGGAFVYPVVTGPWGGHRARSLRC